MQNSSNRPIEDEKMFDLCVNVLSLDRGISFCALAHKSGYLMALASSSRNSSHHKVTKNNGFKNSSGSAHATIREAGIEKLDAVEPSRSILSEVELEKYIFQSGIIWGIHKLWERKLGHVRHIVSYYDEMPLVTLFVDNEHFLLLGIGSATRNSNIDRIVLQKIVPSLEKLSTLMR